jgi:hypothetical protein
VDQEYFRGLAYDGRTLTDKGQLEGIVIGNDQMPRRGLGLRCCPVDLVVEAVVGAKLEACRALLSFDQGTQVPFMYRKGGRLPLRALKFSGPDVGSGHRQCRALPGEQRKAMRGIAHKRHAPVATTRVIRLADGI